MNTGTPTIPTTNTVLSIPYTTIRAEQPEKKQDDTPNIDTNIDIPDYTVLRQKNLDKINKYYDKILSSYTKTYTDYSTQSASANVNDRTYANTTLRPKVQDNNTQIINLSKEMIKNVNQDTELIMQQKDELSNKTHNIDTLLNNIKLLKIKDTDMTILTKARNDSLDSTKSGADDMNFSTSIYIGINVLMVLTIIGIVMYIVYSNYQNTNTNTNIYANINKVNNNNRNSINKL